MIEITRDLVIQELENIAGITLDAVEIYAETHTDEEDYPFVLSALR